MIINIVPALSAICATRLNDVGRRNGSEALRRAVCLNCVICAVEGDEQFGCAWPCDGIFVGGQGGLKLSRGALRTKKVLIENKRNTRIAIIIAIQSNTFDIIMRRILKISIRMSRSSIDG
jgi:hypothetical protein